MLFMKQKNSRINGASIAIILLSLVTLIVPIILVGLRINLWSDAN